MLLLLLSLASSIDVAHAVAALPSSPELLASLSHAGLENPELLRKALHTIELQSLPDILMLDAGERAEMFASLQAMDVGLGSRAKLRHLVDLSGRSGAVDTPRNNAEDTTMSAARASLHEAQAAGRQLQQESIGGSMDSFALAITALLGITSYLVDAKLSRDAKRLQKESDALRADNARAETKAEHLLSRVQGQMERFVAPLNASTTQCAEAICSTMGELGLASQVGHWQLAWLEVAAASHIEVFHLASSTTVATCMKSPYFKLAPEDIAVLENDTSARQRYTELVTATWLPPMRVMAELFSTQVRSGIRLACRPMLGIFVR
jgi:hypothetical protein